jgi:hypothetical protein
MTDHTPISTVSRLEVVSTGARRRWTLEEKQRIVAESCGGPRLVSMTARRNGVQLVNPLHETKRDAGDYQHRPSVLQRRDCEHRSYLHDYIILPCVLRPALDVTVHCSGVANGLRRAFGRRSVSAEARGQS